MWMYENLRFSLIVYIKSFYVTRHIQQRFAIAYILLKVPHRVSYPNNLQGIC